MDPLQQPFEEIARRAVPGGLLRRCWPLAGGISAGMHALEIALPGGGLRRVIVRQPAAPEMEYHLLRRLRALGLLVPEPLGLDESGALLPAPYLLLAYVSGRPEFDPARMAGRLPALAGTLAAIHRAPLDAFDDLPAALPPVAAALPPLPDADPALQAGRVRVALAANWPIPRRSAPALLHGDYWPGNILWRAGRLAAVIDWEDAAYGDPLLDFAIARLDLLWIFGRAALEAFSRAYLDANPLDTTFLPNWDLYAALRLARLAGEDLEGWSAYFHAYGRSDITAATILAQTREYIDGALEKIQNTR